jgi:hypothetical protein
MYLPAGANNICVCANHRRLFANTPPFHERICSEPDNAARPVQPWAQWQKEVLALLRKDLDDTAHQISLDDVDWMSWEQLYLEGRSPHAAIDRVLERDL